MVRGLRAARFGMRGRKGAFQHIFRSRYWGDEESVSGIGSSLEQTAAIRRELPRIVQEHGIRSLFDAPCGDLYWMSRILEEMGIRYVGGDIVPEVIALARSRTDYADAQFIEFDIVEQPFPDCDMWLCRDVLFHLPYGAIRRALDNFLRSNVKYLLVTTHTRQDVTNRNLITGDFRELDLFKAPFGFPADKVLYRFADSAAPQPPRDMVMFAREDLVGHKLI